MEDEGLPWFPAHATSPYSSSSSKWKLPEAYMRASILCDNNAQNMRCFLWCVSQREDLPSLPAEIIHAIWKVASRTFWEEMDLSGGGVWCTEQRLRVDGFRIEWPSTEDLFVLEESDDVDEEDVPPPPKILAAPAA
jgi:hypothetical protein